MLMRWLACTWRLMSRTVLELGRSSTQMFSSENALMTCTTQSPLSAAMRPRMLVSHRHTPSDLDLGPKGLSQNGYGARLVKLESGIVGAFATCRFLLGEVSFPTDSAESSNLSTRDS